MFYLLLILGLGALGYVHRGEVGYTAAIQPTRFDLNMSTYLGVLVVKPLVLLVGIQHIRHVAGATRTGYERCKVCGHEPFLAKGRYYTSTWQMQEVDFTTQ